MKKVKEVSLAEQNVLKQQEQHAATAAALENTTAGAIWSEIKGRPIDMFALPNQTVDMHCHPIPVEPSKLYLLINSSAVLPALETAVGRGYLVNLVDKFVTVSRS